MLLLLTQREAEMLPQALQSSPVLLKSGFVLGLVSFLICSKNNTAGQASRGIPTCIYNISRDKTTAYMSFLNF